MRRQRQSRKRRSPCRLVKHGRRCQERRSAHWFHPNGAVRWVGGAVTMGILSFPCVEECAMSVKVAINGYGRIGRNMLRALYEAKRTGEIQIVAVNDLGDAATNAHLTQYDTAHGRFPGEVGVDGGDLIVN